MTMRWLSALSAAALATTGGCAMMHGSESKSETTSAQNAAHDQFQRAADAQKQATEEQQKAEEADKQVADTQKALAEAEAKAKGQHEKATQAQANAQKLAQEASQQGMQQQQSASSAMQRETTAQGQQVAQRESWRQQKSISGKVVEASGSNLRVRSAGQTDDMNLALDDSTALRVNGRSAKSDQIQPGDEVRASYQMVDGKATAVRVDVRRSSGSSSTDTQPQPQPTDSNPK